MAIEMPSPVIRLEHRVAVIKIARSTVPDFRTAMAGRPGVTLAERPLV